MFRNARRSLEGIAVKTLIVVAMLALAGSLLISPGVCCGAGSSLRVATFTCDVTPPIGHPLCGGSRIPVEQIEDPLSARGVVLADQDNRYVLCAIDWCVLCNSAHEMFCSKIAEAVDTDPSRVVVHCVHQHTSLVFDADAQRLLDKHPNPPQHGDLAFLDRKSSEVAAAAGAACKRMLPLDKIGVGQAPVERVASIRRVPIEGGKVRTRWSSCKDPELRAMPEGNIDPKIKTITFVNGDRPVARLHYYATHPQSFYGDGRVSADVPGFARDRLQQEDGALQIYFTGCAGDVTMGKYNDGTRRARDELSERLYEGMKAAVAATEYQPVDSIGWRTVDVKLPPRSDGAYDPDKNLAIVQDAKADPMQRMGAASHIASARRLAEPVQVSVLELDGVSMLHLPGEPMIEFQHYAQGICPTRFVTVAGYGLGSTGYICTEAAYEEGGYEPTASALEPKAEKLFKAAIAKALAAD